MLFKNPRKFTTKQANIVENFAEIFTNNQAKNINKTSDEIEKKLEALTKNSNKTKKVVRQAGEGHRPVENELTLDGGSDLDKQIGAVEKTGPPIGKNLADIINNVLFKSVSREKLVQKLEKHSLKIQRSENTKDSGLRFKSSRSNLQSH